MNTSITDSPAWLAGASYVVDYVENELGISLDDTGLTEYREENVKVYGHSLHLSDEELAIMFTALQFHPELKFDKKIADKVEQLRFLIQHTYNYK
jgi:hypothetical protein